MEKRGQAVLEFLFTYGWAILAVLISLGTLTYFGVIDASTNFIPEFCIIEAGVSCDASSVFESGNIFIQTTNHLGKTMKAVSVNLIDKQGKVCNMYGPATVKPGESAVFSSDINDPDCKFEAGEFVDLDIDIDYETVFGESNLLHNIDGNLYNQVGQDPDNIPGGECDPTDNPICGNNIAECEELCDGTDVRGVTCEDLDYANGNPGCLPDCTFDYGSCIIVNPGCGDGILDFGEACDDGNNLNCDGCRFDCTIVEFCGNGLSECWENCDGNDLNGETCVSIGDLFGGFVGGDLSCESYCDYNYDGCYTEDNIPVCGNDVVEIGEECDDGIHNSDTGSDACRTDCTNPSCGDNVIDSGEQCDDGNNVNGDGCSASCTAEGGSFCGNGVIDPGEECDDNNNNNCDGCSASCGIEFPASCGNGVLECGEGCDDGNNVDGDGCSSTCQPEAGPDGDGSFLPGTKIIMSDRTTKNIEDVNIGDMVLSYDERNERITSEKVSALLSHIMPGYYIINNNLEITATNPVLANGGWTYPGSLQVGDALLNDNAAAQKIESIIYIDKEVVVFNLQIEGAHTYFAGGINVHNQEITGYLVDDKGPTTEPGGQLQDENVPPKIGERLTLP